MVGTLLVALVGVGDLATGSEVSFSLFYVLPVGMVAWLVGRRPAAILAWTAAGVWLVADRLGGSVYSARWIAFWNSAVRLGYFLIIGYLIDRVRRMLLAEQELAQIDRLTGVLNGRQFVIEVEAEINRLRRYGHPLALIYLDLDDFKAINDLRGHLAGDEVLTAVAGILRTSTRATDKVGRMGGDEFAVLLVETEPHGAETVASKVLATIEGSGIIGVSMGLATCDEAPDSADDLIRAADEAMYAAKRLGKGRVEARHVGPRQPATG